MNKCARVMLAAMGSGCGKTTVTCGLLTLLKRRKKITAFKCGPDYIDPMFHEKVLNVPSKNLDTWFVSEDTVRWLFRKEACSSDISVIEGVMGYYDGLGGVTERGSSWELAKILECPVVLIVDAKGKSVSVLAEIQGFLHYQEPSMIQGIILNHIAPMFYPRLKQLIEERLHIPVAGYLPEIPELGFKSRHLGLIMPEEIPDFHEQIERLADIMEESLDVSLIEKIAAGAESAAGPAPSIPARGETVRIGVAKDAAFCFYYKDNLELLERFGAELVYFSPLQDRTIPEQISGLILGGGYPELYAEQLSRNESMRTSVRTAIRGGLPCIAECGGYLYLHRELEDPGGERWPMAGVFDAHAWKENRLGHFGYIELEIKRDMLFGARGTRIRGHEFHYYRSSLEGDAVRAEKPVGSQAWDAMYGTPDIAAGFPHLYYYADPGIAGAFLDRCSTYRRNL